MADSTRIEWADATWNPIVGCSPVASGCASCYASRMAQRLARMPATSELYRGVHVKGRWNGTIAVANDATWAKPFRWRNPRRIFVCSMGDLFHVGVTFNHVDRVMMTAEQCQQHTFLLLTKRPSVMRSYFVARGGAPRNVWCGASASTPEEANYAAEQVMAIKAQVRWLSLEPYLVPFGPDTAKPPDIDWIVIGPETGPHRRPAIHPHYYQTLVNHYRGKAPVFVKAIPVIDPGGGWFRISKEISQWTESLRAREWPCPRN